VLLLIFAVVTAVIVPRFNGVLTRGTAVSAPVVPPPEIGTCISSFVSARVTAGASSPSVPVPSAHYGSCAGPIAGEVLSVQASAELGRELSVAGYDSASMTCAQGVAAYLGAPPELNGGSAATRWLPAAQYTTLLVGPDDQQRAAGRTWSACVVTSVASTTYARPVRGAFDGGSLQDQFGYCLNSIDLSDWVPCSTAHSAQVLAWGAPARSGASPSKADCRAAAAALMGTTDPTKGGSLDVGLIGDQGVGSVQACGVQVEGSRRLTGSVAGIKAGLPVLTG
jgi:hypothetical protein